MQTRVEINDYCRVFDRIAVFEGLYRWTSVKGGTHTGLTDLLDIYASYKACSPLNASSAVWRFERSNAIKICKGIIFDFHAGPSCTLVHAEISRSFQLLCHLARVDMRGLLRKKDLILEAVFSSSQPGSCLCYTSDLTSHYTNSPPAWVSEPLPL